MEADVTRFIQLMRNPVKLRMYLMVNIPSAYFAGVWIAGMDENTCTVTVPFKWFSQNPFRSTYFACLAMAAEMSTGALAMAHLYKVTPNVSMLVTDVQGSFIKKATGLTTFVCRDGPGIKAAISEALSTGNPAAVKATSVGRNKAGEIVAEFVISWSFKARSAGKG